MILKFIQDYTNFIKVILKFVQDDTEFIRVILGLYRMIPKLTQGNAEVWSLYRMIILYRGIRKYVQDDTEVYSNYQELWLGQDVTIKGGGHAVGNLCCISNGRRNIVRGGRQSAKSSFWDQPFFKIFLLVCRVFLSLMIHFSIICF
jgi:hypothetical protein